MNLKTLGIGLYKKGGKEINGLTGKKLLKMLLTT